MGHLRVENLSFRHLGPMSFEVRPGECLCITGASGTGKSLLLRAIVDLDPHEGCVYLDDAEAGEMDAPRWRKSVGLLVAESQWWYGTVGEHFSEVSAEWLEAVGFDRRVLDWEIHRLSTGEKQRLAIVRLLTGGPRALLLDEPTASLDQGTVEKVEALIREYARSRQVPVIWVSHDPLQVRRVASRAYLFRDGRLEEADL